MQRGRDREGVGVGTGGGGAEGGGSVDGGMFSFLQMQIADRTKHPSIDTSRTVAGPLTICCPVEGRNAISALGNAVEVPKLLKLHPA